jgi:NAD(P)-dependent dehydrogenase (short-subunit alcohol dehydrogenase family)
MREQGSGTIVNVSSVLGRLGAPHQSAYAASKHGIRALGECARQELSDLPDLHVCTVLPGPTDTPLFEHAANYSGRRIKPLSPVIDANRVADAIVRCVRHPRREVAVGASPKGAVLAARVVPGMAERAARRQVERDHFADAPAGPDRGNLVEPASGPGAVSGGWTRSGDAADQGVSGDGARGHHRSRAAVAAGAALVVGAAGAVWTTISRRSR